MGPKKEPGGSLGRSRRVTVMVSLLKQIGRRRASLLIRAFLMVSLVVATLCPMMVMVPTSAFGALEITVGPDMDMGTMPCPASLCPSEQLSTARHDILQTIRDQLAHAVAVIVPGTAVGTEPHLTRVRFVSDSSPPRSPQHIPLYLLHVSLIR